MIHQLDFLLEINNSLATCKALVVTVKTYSIDLEKYTELDSYFRGSKNYLVSADMNLRSFHYINYPPN